MTSTESIANLNVPEKIDSLCGPEKLFICVDYNIAKNYDNKRVLRNFIDMKTLVNHHEIAMAVFSATEVAYEPHAEINPTQVLSRLCDRVKYPDQKDQKQGLDLDSIFTKVLQQVTPYKHVNVSVRAIVLYGRLDTLPFTESSGPLATLQREFQYFTLDILFMPQFNQSAPEKRKRLEQKRAQEIFQSLCEISNEKSYVFASENCEEIVPRVLKFLAHPALREKQKAEWFQ